MKSRVVWLIIGLLVVLLGAGAYFAYKTGLIKPSAAVTGDPVVVGLSPKLGSYKVGDLFNVAITLNTGGNSTVGTQAYLTYDATKLEVQDQDSAQTGIQLAPGTLYGTVMTNKVDAATGKISFAAVAAGSQAKFTGTGTLATIKFKALATTTEASPLAFTFVQGSTGETTLVGMDEQNLNILTSVENGSYTITDAAVTPAAKVTLTANPASVSAGGSSTLTWTNATDACTATPSGWFDSTKANGTASVKPASTTTYKLTCGADTAQVTVSLATASASASASASATRTATPTATLTSAVVLTTTATTAASTTTRAATTGPETPLIAGGFLSLLFASYFVTKRYLG